MALLAEEIVEEWLNREGYFTIRGIRVGVHEIDLLAIRPQGRGWKRRHVEVQASVRPVSYITPVPKDVQKETGRAAGSAKLRSPAELKRGVAEWVHKKYDLPAKRKVMQRLCRGPWTRELVVNAVKHEHELVEIECAGVTVHRLDGIVRKMASESPLIGRAAASDFFDLMVLLNR